MNDSERSLTTTVKIMSAIYNLHYHVERENDTRVVSQFLAGQSPLTVVLVRICALDGPISGCWVLHQ